MRQIKYYYYSWNMGCDCCWDSRSAYDVLENGVVAQEDIGCDLFCNERELREYLVDLEPFEVHPDTRYF